MTFTRNAWSSDRRLSGYIPILLGLCGAMLMSACATQQSLYVYRAYQEPKTARGPYYLREALIVATDHATAMNIIARALTEIHPGWSGPLYVTLVGVSEPQQHAGLLGGPVWLETAADTAPQPFQTAASTADQMRENLAVGTPVAGEGWLPPIVPRHERP